MMNNKIYVMLAAAMLLSVGMVSAEVNAVTPSTNDENRDFGWAHVNVLDARVGEIDLEFVNPRGFASCFEYRTDGDTSQASGNNNYNPDVTDGLYPFVCTNNNVAFRTPTADEFVEVRMVFGAEGDERFDWTRFDVLPPPGAIVSPEANEEIVSGTILELEAHDVGAKDGNVQWAVRQGTCAASTGTVAGNVDTFSTAYVWTNGVFTSSVDTTGYAAGNYCFVFNPTEGDRLTQLFSIVDPVLPGPMNPETKQDCMKGGWEEFDFKNQGQCIRYVNTGKDSR